MTMHADVHSCLTRDLKDPPAEFTCMSTANTDSGCAEPLCTESMEVGWISLPSGLEGFIQGVTPESTRH